MMPSSSSGSGNAASTSQPPEEIDWDRELAIPDSEMASEELRTRVKFELRSLFAVGRTRTISESKFDEEFCEPLGLDKASKAFCEKLSDHIATLFHDLGTDEEGKPKIFSFRTKADQSKFDSILYK